VISLRYEQGALIMTSNRAFKEWPTIFNHDSTLTSAVLDRLLGDVSQVLMYYTPNRLSTQCSPTRSSVIMILQVLHCPHCQGTDVVRHGQTRQGKQRYRCREHPCASRTFLLDYSYPGQSPEVKQQIIDMAMNASGIRDTARVLHVRDYPETFK
jgi:transposase-like protein